MKFSIRAYPDIKEQVERMTIRQLLEQVSCPAVVPQGSDYVANTATLFLHGGDYEEACAFVKAVNARREQPVLGYADIEAGCGSVLTGTTCFPSLMGIAKAGEGSAYAAGRIAGREARSAGYQWSAAPCVDIQITSISPMASVRTPGRDVEEIIRTGREYIRGLQEEGVAGCAKHFPGDGATIGDQHLNCTENPLSREEWMGSYGRVYRELIEDGVATIMIGHLTLPAYDEVDEEMGLYPPATLSKRLMTDLLKQELGFEGIISSDALCMSGFCGFMNYYKGCATFLKAGGDVLLFAKCTPKYYEELEVYVTSGYLPLEVLRERAYRVMCFVRQMQEMPVPAENPYYDNREAIAAKISADCIEVVRDRKGILPFALEKQSTRILHAVISNDYTGIKPAEDFQKELERLCDNVEYQVDPGPNFMLEAAESGAYDLIVCSNCNMPSYGTNVVQLHGPVARNMMEGWTKFDTPVAFVAFGHPYLHTDFSAMVDTCVNTYGFTEDTIAPLMKKLFVQREG